jgi:flagellar biogenesis protein FliO
LPAASQPAAVPSAGGFLPGMGSVAQVAAALAVVIGLILVGKGLAKKFVPSARVAPGKGVIEVLARHPLAKNQSLVLVRIGSQIVALNQGKESSESVLVISDQNEVARIIGQIEGQSPKSIQAGFNNLLANARMDLERADDEQEPDLRTLSPESLDEQLDEMAAAKRQLMELRQHVRSVRDSLPRG